MRMRRARAVVLAPLVALTLALATACAATPAPAASSPPVPTAPALTLDPAAPVATVLPDGVAVELRQSRADVAGRQAAVRFINGSGVEITVGAVSVADPRFAASAERTVNRMSRVAPGAAVDVRVQLAEVACDASAGSDATVTLALATNGDASVVRVPITDPVPFVEALHTRECVHERVADAAAIDFGPFSASPPEEPGRLTLLIQPRGGAAAEGVRLVGIRETNLLTFEGIGGGGLYRLGFDLTPGSTGAVTVSLPLRPARCDPHAVLEDKRGTVFRVLVELDGEEASFDLAASEELRGRLLDWVAGWCGFGED
jgi:hypothetical protein